MLEFAISGLEIVAVRAISLLSTVYSLESWSKSRELLNWSQETIMAGISPQLGAKPS